MPQPTVEETPPKEVVFDEHGNTMEGGELEADPVADAARAAAEGGEPVVEAAKFRIGDREFSTETEALAFAQSQIEVDNAYQQGVRDAASQFQPAGGGVTPSPAVASTVDNVEELYTNPQEFLKKYATKIKSETIGEFNQTQSLKQQSDSIWREFTDRHPALADFRQEVEGFVQMHNPEVRALIQTKGRTASYDFIATKLRSRFEAYAGALKPKRELPNGGAGASPTQKGASVTPKPQEKKPLSFAEQVRSIRKAR